MNSSVKCRTHGTAGRAFVCGHAFDAYSKGRPQSFFWTDDNEPEPCGWCAECQARFEAAGNDWVGEASEKLDGKLVCEHCFRDIMTFNGYT